MLTNARLIPWMRSNISPLGWIVELTGGEPALYNGIDELVTELTRLGYHGLIKTNGLLPIKKTDGFLRVAAFHQLDNPPKFFDRILIIDKLQRDEKEAFCKAAGWDYRVIGLDNENPDGARHGFHRFAFMDPHGHPTPCKAAPVRWEPWPDKYALEYTPVKRGKACGHCKAAIDAWRFLPEEWKK